MPENERDRPTPQQTGTHTSTSSDETIVIPGDVCRRCGTYTSPWRCCCETTRTTLPEAVVLALDFKDIAERGRANQADLFASGWTVPGAALYAEYGRREL